MVASSAVTVTTISFEPMARFTSDPGSTDTFAAELVAVAVTVVVSTELPTLAWYDATAPENVPMSMPARLREPSVASCEIELIVTVAEPIAEPPREAVTVTVSACSSS